jgi:hypothetical protein
MLASRTVAAGQLVFGAGSFFVTAWPDEGVSHP